MSVIYTAKKTAKFTKADQSGVINLVEGEEVTADPSTLAAMLEAGYVEKTAVKSEAAENKAEKKSAKKSTKKAAKSDEGGEDE